jgi:hypothetical protein
VRRSHEGGTREPRALCSALGVFDHATMRSGERAYTDSESDKRPIPEMPSRLLIDEFRILQGFCSQAIA